MTAPRPLNDGAKVGWGLLALIITVYGALVAAATAATATIWKRVRKS